ncbi:uncharacterized protein LOC143460977 isoform X3 [Clavelina lepadiformis]|uniref:uncharacterized protein LOC143460977 isoform X3 n=1 Tax=Clavelina lepadiformis TaxID=159417 RepID=UPI0040438DDB
MYRKKKKNDTGTVLSKEQFNTLESEHERNRFIDTTLTSDQQNTTIQPQSSNQQGVLLKKEVQHRPDYSDFENRKSEILWHLNSFTSKELITKKMKRFESNRHEPETSDVANIMKHWQGSFDEQHRIHSSYQGQSSHQRLVSDDAAASSSYSDMASLTNSAPAEESPFDCQDKIDFTMKQLNFLEDEFGYSESLKRLRL